MVLKIMKMARRIFDDDVQSGGDSPAVPPIGTRHHMFSCCRGSFDFTTERGRDCHIGHAWSDDLAHWIRDDEHLLLEGTAGEWNGRILLRYNGNEFGHRGFGLAVLVA